MHRSIFQPFRTIAALAVAVGAIACADRADPTGLADLAADAGNRKSDSASCDLSISGRIFRYAGVSDSAGDTLGVRQPLPGARIEVAFLRGLPSDTVPRDSVPRDSVPRDSVPRDSVPRDSVPRDSVPGGDTLTLRGSFAAAQRDTSRGPAPKPTATAVARGDGSYAIDGLCAGYYRITIHEPGTGRSIFLDVALRRDMANANWTFAPLRR